MSNSTFESSKLLAAIGAVLTFLGFVPVLPIIGLILVLIGMKGLAEHYRDESIYKNAFTGVIFGIIGFIVLAVSSIGFGTLSVFTFSAASVIGGIIGLILIMIVGFIFFLFMAINFRKALYALADRSGEHLFHTAGTLLFIGAVLTIILVGYVLVFIAWILATIAFFSLKSGASAPSYSYTPPPTAQPPPAAPTATNGTQYCPHCGAPVAQGAAFCSHCGKQI